MFLDSHCHLTAPQLAPQLDEVLDRAAAAGVGACLNIGDNLASSEAALGQVEPGRHHGLRMWCTAGVHPQHALEYDLDGDSTEKALRRLAAYGEVRAIGEIGLDFVYDDRHPDYPGATREVQEKVFIRQLRLAAELSLPVVIHNREADERLLAIMAEHRWSLVGAVFHCFGSAPEVARAVLDLDCYLGFTGLVTFKNAQMVRDVARLCPLNRLLIETDSPYLAPVPHRGKTNEPSFLPRVAETIAALHDISVVEVGDITTRNAAALFGLEFESLQ